MRSIINILKTRLIYTTILFLMLSSLESIKAVDLFSPEYKKAYKQAQSILAAATDFRKSKKLSYDELLIQASLYSWSSDLNSTLKKMSDDQVSTEKKEFVRIYLNVLHGNRWSTRHALQNIKAAKNNSSIRFIPPDVIQWLNRWVNLSEAKSLPRARGPYVFAIGARLWHQQNYLEAAEAFYQVAKKYSTYKSDHYRLFTQVAFINAEWAIAYARHSDLSSLEKKKITELNQKLQNLKIVKNRVISKALPSVPAEVVSAGSYLPRYIKTVQNAESFSGEFFYKGGGSFHVDFSMAAGSQKMLFKKNNRTVLASHNDKTFWPDEDGVLVTRYMFSNYNPVKSYLNADFQFARTRTDNSFNMLFIFKEAPGFHLGLDQFWEIIQNKPVLAWADTQNRWQMLRLDPENPMGSTTFLIEKDKKNLHPVKIWFQSAQSDSVIGFSDLAFNENTVGLNLPYAKEKTAEVEYALPGNYYDRALLNMLYRDISVNKTPEEKNREDITNRIVLEYQKDLNAIRSQTAPDYMRLAKKYAEIAQKYDWASEARLIASRFYASAYDYHNTLKYLDQYFELEEIASLKSELSTNIGNPDKTVNSYLYALVQTGELDRSLNFLDHLENKAVQNHNKKRIAEIAVLKAEVLAREGRFEQALKTLEKLENGRLNIPAEYKASSRKIRIFLYGFLEKFDRARKLIDEYGFKDDFPQNWPAPDEKSVRLKFQKPVSGQGENFCGPVAVQFVMRYLKNDNTDQKSIARSMGTQNSGTNFSAIMKYTRQKNIMAVAFLQSETNAQEKLAFFLRNGYPVLTLMSSPESNLGHITAVAGLDQKSGLYYLSEPNTPFAITTIQQKTLKRRQLSNGSLFLAFAEKSDYQKVQKYASKTAELILQYLDQYTSGSEDELFTLLDKIESLAKKEKVLPQIQKFIEFQRYNLVSKKLYQNKKIEGEARKTAKAALRHEVDYRDDYMINRAIGEIMLSAGKSKDAEGAFLAALRNNRYDIYSRLRLSQIYLQSNNTEQAQKQLLMALQNRGAFHGFNSLRPNILVQLARIAESQNKPDAVINYLLQAANLHRQDELSRVTINQLKKQNATNLMLFLRKKVFY